MKIALLLCAVESKAGAEAGDYSTIGIITKPVESRARGGKLKQRAVLECGRFQIVMQRRMALSWSKAEVLCTVAKKVECSGM